MTEVRKSQNQVTLEETLASLRAIYETLPATLRTECQGISSCPQASWTLSWAVEELQYSPHPLTDQPPPTPPSWRWDSQTNEVFIGASAGFTLTGAQINGATAVHIHGCTNFLVDLQGFAISEQERTRKKFFLNFYDCRGFTLRGISAEGGRNLAMIEACDRFLVSDVTCRDYEGYGLIILHSRMFQVTGCRFENNLASGVMILGDCQDGTISNCRFIKSQGYYNWDAGLHISHCSRRVTAAQVPELCHEPLAFLDKVLRPRRIRVFGSVFTHNRAQGIYLEGAQECLISGNTITDNNKEGVCFDWGTSMCLFTHNFVKANGYRSNMTEREIQIDFVADFPLMPDQSSTCKLPGLSFDNGVLNAIVDNEICSNFGGGIKMVRAAVGNYVQGNRFWDNARGTNFYVKKVYDVYILSLGNRGGEFDDDRTSLLDFHLSSFNRFHANIFASAQPDALHHGNEYNVFEGNQFNSPPGGLPPPKTTSRRRPGRQPSATPSSPRVSPYTLYAFGSTIGQHSVILRLRPDGTIEFSSDPNESHWRIEGQQLLFFDRGYNLSTRFNTFSGPATANVFVGSIDPSGSLHYLIPILSTENRPVAPELPPVLVNTLPRCGTHMVQQFFAELGWAPTGLHCGPQAVEEISDAPLTEIPRTANQDTLPCSFRKVASIVQAGQVITGHLPWKDEFQQITASLLCIYGTRNLRDALVSRFRFEETEPSPAGNHLDAWRYISNPKDKFLAFLDMCKGEYSTWHGFSPWLDNDKALTVRFEDIINRALTPSLTERLWSLGISAKQIQGALDRSLYAERSSFSGELPTWKDYWSDGAERVFKATGLRRLNQRMGYEA